MMMKGTRRYLPCCESGRGSLVAIVRMQESMVREAARAGMMSQRTPGMSIAPVKVSKLMISVPTIRMRNGTVGKKDFPREERVEVSGIIQF